MDFRDAHRRAELEQRLQAIFARLEARDQVVCALIAQRLTLAEAIEQFLELDRQWSDGHTIVPRMHADRTPEVRAHQYILVKVKDILHDRPEQASTSLSRLE
jgi:hypothetical protein